MPTDTPTLACVVGATIAPATVPTLLAEALRLVREKALREHGRRSDEDEGGVQ